MMVKKIKNVLISLSGLVLLLNSCSESPKVENKEFLIKGETMGSTYEVKYISNTENNYQNSIDSLLLAFNKSISTYDSTSRISKIFRGEEKEMDKIISEVIKKAKDVYEFSDGSFDISVGPLSNAWGWGFKNREQMDSIKVKQLLSFVGFNKVKIENNALILDSGMYLDFNSIAPGYAADLIGEYLMAHGITNFMIEVGGEILCKGKNLNGKFWRIGIEKPMEGTEGKNPLEGIIELQDEALATSGNYRRVFYENGRRFAHTLNPLTGWPVSHNLLSATVICKTAIEADAYATLCMVIGLEKAIEKFKDKNEVGLYLIYEDENKNLKEYLSPNLKSRFTDNN